MILITMTEHQRKRFSKGRSVPILLKGVWYKISPANKTKVGKIREELKKLKEQLKTEMRKKVVS